MRLLRELDEAEILALANSADGEAGRVIYKVVKLLRDKGREVNESKPQESPGDLRADFRTINGEIFACNQILDLPRAARTIIQKEESRA